MTHQLAVWLFTTPIGTLTLVNERLSFTYMPEWLRTHDSTFIFQ